MADKTRAQMITKALQRLGVLAQGQTASANDSTLAGEVLDSVYKQLRLRGLAPFPTSAFPDQAQEPFTKIMEEELGPYFGRDRMGMRALGERELSVQYQPARQRVPIETDAY